MPDLAARARTLLDLHTAPEILVLANVWDVVSARVVAGTDGRPGPRHRQPLHRGDVRLRGRREHPARPAPGHGRPDRRRGGPAGDDGPRGRLRRRRRDRPPGHRGRRRRRQPRGPDEAARRGGRRRRGGARAPAGTPASTSSSTPAPTSSPGPRAAPTAARSWRRRSPRPGVPRGRRPGGVRARARSSATRSRPWSTRSGRRSSASSPCRSTSLPVRELQELGRRPGVDRPVHPAGRADRAAGRGRPNSSPAASSPPGTRSLN